TIRLAAGVTHPGSADPFTHPCFPTRRSSDLAAGSDNAFSFTPDDNGSYVVTLTVTDDDGGVGSDTATISVANVAPTATINGAPAISAERTPTTVTVRASDPGSADTITHLWSV